MLFTYTFFSVLAIATLQIQAERCLFSADDLQKIHEHQDVHIDGREIVAFIKNNPNEASVLKFIENNRDHIRTYDEHRYLLDRIIDHNGIGHMVCNERMSKVISEYRADPHAIGSLRARDRLMRMTNRVMLVHGVYGAALTCARGVLSINCGMSAGGLTTVLVLSKIEQKAVAKFAPKIVKVASAIGLVIPRVRFAVRLLNVKVASGILKTGGAVLGGVFDIVDIGINVKFLLDCKASGRCSHHEIRDSIVSLSISGVSFMAGVAFAVLAMPGVGLIVGVALLMVQLFYTAISTVTAYHERYHLTFDEGADTFLRSLIFMGPSANVRMLAKQTDHFNLSAATIWSALNNYGDTVKGYGMGLGEITLADDNVRPTQTHIDLTEIGTRTVSRAIPHSIDANAEMICAPAYQNLPYENGQSNHVDGAYYCHNAMVLIDKRRVIGHTVVMNLQLVQGGSIKGSNHWNNIFLAYNTNGYVGIVGR